MCSETMKVPLVTQTPRDPFGPHMECRGHGSADRGGGDVARRNAGVYQRGGAAWPRSDANSPGSAQPVKRATGSPAGAREVFPAADYLSGAAEGRGEAELPLRICCRSTGQCRVFCARPVRLVGRRRGRARRREAPKTWRGTIRHAGGFQGVPGDRLAACRANP